MARKVPKGASRGSEKRRKDTARKWYQGGFRI